MTKLHKAAEQALRYLVRSRPSALDNFDEMAERHYVIEDLQEALAQQDFFKELTGQSMLSLWSNYCDKKMQVEELQAKLDALAQQGEQQPVAWLEQEWSGSGLKHLHFERREPTVRDEVVCPVWTPLYAGAAPAAQPDTWTDDGGWTFPIEKPAQPLTDEQIEEMHEEQDFIATLFQVKRIVRATELAHGIGEKK